MPSEQWGPWHSIPCDHECSEILAQHQFWCDENSTYNLPDRVPQPLLGSSRQPQFRNLHQLAFSEYQPSHGVGMQTHRISRLLALHSPAQMDSSWPAGADQSSPDGFWMFLVSASHPQPHQPPLAKRSRSKLSDPHCTNELTPGPLLLAANAKIRFNRFNFNGLCCTLIELALLVKLNRSTNPSSQKNQRSAPLLSEQGPLGTAFHATTNAPKFSRSTSVGAMKIRPTTFATRCRNLCSTQ